MGRKINIKVIPGSKRNIVKEQDGILKVYTTAPAIEGKANKAIVSILAEHFSIRKGQIEIIKGLKNRNKIVNIES